MVHAALVDPAHGRPPTAPASDPLEAVLALCMRARPHAGGNEALELSRLLDAAARAGGAAASDRIAHAMAHADWWEPPPVHVQSGAGDEHVGRAADERRLVAKLAACGRLRPELMLSALAQGRMALFHAVLAGLNGCDPAVLEREARNPAVLALAMRAAGIDRAAFAPILAQLQGLDAQASPVSAGQAQAVAAALARSPAQASAGLAKALRA